MPIVMPETELEVGQVVVGKRSSKLKTDETQLRRATMKTQILSLLTATLIATTPITHWDNATDQLPQATSTCRRRG
jgi:hypothetical protein